MLPFFFAVELALFAAAGQNPAAVPETDITQPPHATVAFSAEGRGSQIYTCGPQGVSYQWTLKAPQADLFDPSGKQVGSHSAGPTWTSTDGSAVTGKVIQKKAASGANIAWLLLAATPKPGQAGAFSHIAFVRRSNTQGGNPPPDGCDAQHPTATVSVPYTATYTFYTAR